MDNIFASPSSYSGNPFVIVPSTKITKDPEEKATISSSSSLLTYLTTNNETLEIKKNKRKVSIRTCRIKDCYIKGTMIKNGDCSTYCEE